MLSLSLKTHFTLHTEGQTLTYSRMEYDVIIAGASFAGLSVAGQQNSRVLVIDRKPIGQGVTSACATFLTVAERLGCKDSVLQVHPVIFVHIRDQVIEYPMPSPFCTFDYQTFCQRLAEQSTFDFLQASVIDCQAGHVWTDKGKFKGRCIVDATGWRSALAHKNEARQGVSFGIEMEVKREDKGLHFVFNSHTVPKGFGWIFPAGADCRIGVCSYQAKTRLKSVLCSFSNRDELRSIHGGYFPAKLRAPTQRGIFAVGDAAGHCLPVTGEGIRTAIYFGEYCGRVIRYIIEGRLSHQEGFAEYERFVKQHKRDFVYLRRLQKTIELIPDFLKVKIAEWAQRNLDYVMARYIGIADPEKLTGPTKIDKRVEAGN